MLEAIKIHSARFTKQVSPVECREEGGGGARPEARLHTSESFRNEFSFPVVKAQRDKGICLFKAGNSDIHLLCESVF